MANKCLMPYIRVLSVCRSQEMFIYHENILFKSHNASEWGVRAAAPLVSNRAQAREQKKKIIFLKYQESTTIV